MKKKIFEFLGQFKTYWKKPKENQYVSYKEIVSFCLGGMGVKSINSLVGYISLAPTCLLIASVYGLSPHDIMILFIITNIIGIVKTPFVSMLVDNTRTRLGKFRPYIIFAGIPAVFSIIALTWFIPLNASALTKIILIGIFINALSIAQPLYNNAYMGISQVITPNSSERTSILSYSEFLGNLGPSIVQLALPSLAGICFGRDGMIDIRTYRIFFPIMAFIGFGMGLLIVKNTKERVIKSDSREEEHISFIDGIRYIAKNRYFWIVTISKFFDGFKSGLNLMLTWVCAYQLGNSAIQGVLQSIVSFGCTPGIVFAPLLIKKLGTRNSSLFANFLNCVMAFIMLLSFKKGIVFFVISLFLYNFAQGPQYIMQTSILSNGFDFQQNRDGVRIEGFAQNFQLMITTLGTILSTIVFTFIYESHGLIADEATGLTDYSILSNTAIREPIITGVIITVIIASFLAAVPYFFYNLSDTDMQQIKRELEEKAEQTSNH